MFGDEVVGKVRKLILNEGEREREREGLGKWTIWDGKKKH
jgi:hypothetical protein